MKKVTKLLSLLIVSVLFAGFACTAQSSGSVDNKKELKTGMKTYVIERNIPGAGQFTPEKLKAISTTSCTVLKEMGPEIQWIN
ncbi:MAG TPA: nickel-binding protein, partial [Puia sp.]